jgi:hypothetical protein
MPTPLVRATKRTRLRFAFGMALVIADNLATRAGR